METNTDVAVIPGGLRAVLQPRGVSVDKLFKDSVRKLYIYWMAEGGHELTPSTKNKKTVN
jgi:hypothetical protein